MKNGILLAGIIVMSALTAGCNNYFHELIPPDGDRITSFEVNGQIGSARIGSSTVEAEVAKDTDLHAVLPRVKISEGATLLPVTLDYVRAAFPSLDLFDAVKMSNSSNIVNTLTDLIKANPDFTIPAIDIPIDFSGHVTMLVISGKGTIRQYKVTVTQDSGEPKLLSLCFSKYDNAELISDARCLINEQNKTVTANILYPMEMDYISYALVPSFEIWGDSFKIDGEEFVTGSAIQFASGLGAQTKTITITRDGAVKDYLLTAVFSEDPDSVRSITDFRFYKADNYSIAANAVAAIINTDNIGTITAQVFYSGARPSTLTPCFISPGVVSVLNVVQTSGSTSQNFTTALEYRVVSKNGMYTRTYTVRVEFISITENTPRITSFGFSSALNPELVQDEDARISDGYIRINARYGGAYPPDTLIPEFRAEGAVTVSGSVQISGSSAQEFSRQVKYTVTNPLNPILTSDYWVQCTFVRDTSSDAAITSFGFYPEDNSGLADAVMGKIDQINGKIEVYAPVGSGLTTRIMFPRFTAAGQVSVEGTPQSPGQSGQMFNAPVTYTVVSANGTIRRTYTVNARELQSTIYVNSGAFGYGDGTSWENAFRDLKTACEAAAQFPNEIPKEIWIAAGTYKPKSNNDYFRLSANTSYVGGFAGHETSKSQRNTAANVVTVSGDLGGGVYTKRLFAAAAELDGDLLFENLSLSGVKGQQGAGIYAPISTASEMKIQDCRFEYLEASGTGGSIFVSGGSAQVSNSAFYACTNGAIYVRGTKAKISGLDFSTCMNGNVVRLDCSGETEITRVNANYSYGTVFYLGGNGNKTLETITIESVGQCLDARDTTGSLRINNLDMKFITGTGISMSGVTGVKRLSDISAVNISGNAINSMSASGTFTLTGSNFDNTGKIIINNTSGAVYVQNSEIKNVHGASSLRITSVNADIDTVTVTGSNYYNDEEVNYILTTGLAAIYLTCSGKASVSNTNIDTFTYYDNLWDDEDWGLGMGIRSSGSGSFSVVNTSIKNVSRGIYHSGQSDLEIDRLNLNDIQGYGIYSSASGGRSIKISKVTAKNISSQAIYQASQNSAKDTILIKDSTLENTGGIASYPHYDPYNSSSPSYVYDDLSDSSVELSIITMNNTRNANSNGAVVINSKNVIIDRVNINGTYSYAGNGRGIKIGYARMVRISNSSIRDCSDTMYDGSQTINYGTPSQYTVGTYGWEGGGIYIQCKGTAEISNTTIENVEACIGGAIYYYYTPGVTNEYTTTIVAGSGADSLTLRGVTIRNAKAIYQPVYSSSYSPTGYGGGVSFYSNGKLNIIDTRMENCSSEVNNGAVYSYSSNNTISGSQFIGCTSSGSIKVLDTGKFGASGYTITP